MKIYLLLLLLPIIAYSYDPFYNHHMHVNHFNHNTSSGGSFKTYKFTPDSSENQKSKWVGLFGATLKNDLKPYPQADMLIQEFQNIAIAKALSLIGIPLFGLAGLSQLPPHEVNHDNEKLPKIPARTIALWSLGLGSFIAYIITDNMESKVLKKIEAQTKLIKLSGDYDFQTQKSEVRLAYHF
jgi:hypothetical protein